MSKRKKVKKHHHRRRHRVGAISLKSAVPILTSIVGTVLGMAGVKLANDELKKKDLSVPGSLLGGAEAVAGGILFVKAKTPFFKAVGLGIASAGAVYALGTNGLAVLPAAIGYGPPGPMRPGRPMMTGYRDVPMVGFPHPGNVGFPKPGNIAGSDREKSRMARMYAGVYG